MGEPADGGEIHDPAPLAPFNGAEPPAPDWFKWAIAQAPARSFIEVDQARIELLVWGERGKPGLLLVHGNSAHADWWSFVAPFLAQDYRVAAISMSGMGGSDWRPAYSFVTFAHEARAGAEAAGLYDAPVAPVFIGHSFGGSQVFHAAVRFPHWMRAAILIDSGLGPTEGFKEPEVRRRPHHVYRTLTEALARFRLRPPQGCDNPFIADYIARRSLKPAPLPDGGMGWTWRFDPFLWDKLDRDVLTGLFDDLSGCAPTVHIYGDKSELMRRIGELNLSRLPASVRNIAIPNAEHHIMVDQPLALVSAIRSVLTFWPQAAQP
jgi:pimeloyl-ACP methyl ester carboxylesterase